uniref:ANK_REP_REGION domain-containing protein n=1 Tax=Mesocestoides corti TaxID=53468 RepID=A0A5K3FPC2_MESCO
MQNQVAAKDRELKSYSRRSDDLSLKLEIINRWCEWLAQSPRSQRVRPTESPSFAINEDSTRWKASFDELCRLDQQIERLRSQRRPHPTVARSNAAPKPPPSYCPPEAQPTGRPPKPANHEFGRHSITGAPKRNSTPVPSPRFNRPASAPVDNSTQPSTSAPQTEISNFTARSGALFCPDLPSPSPVPLKPRYASQKVINATYLTPPQRRNVHTDEYKRSASEYFQAQMASRQLQSVEFLLPEATKLSANDLPSDLPETAVPYSEEESTSTTSTSSSSLAPSKTTQNTVAVIDGSEDSAIADSEGLPAASQESPKKDGEEGEVGMKPILRRTADEGDEAEREGEVGSPKAGVRFHPLALLLDAALEGDLALVKKAAAEVSDVSEANDEGITALHNAVCAGRVDVVEFLVKEAGADVNAGDTDGWTPLHCAASCGNVELARILVENGAALHARTLSDHETSLDKCDQGDGDAECERYLSAEIELLGRADNGRVYALFPRGLEAAGPGSPDAYIEPDELPIWPNEELRIIDRCPAGEPDWMLAEKSGEGNKQQGLVPLAFISRFPVVRIPPASQPMPSLASSAKPNSRQYRPPSPIEEEEEASSTETEMADDSESPQMVEKEDLDTEEAAHGGGSGEPGDRSKSNGTDVGVNGQSLAGLEEGIVRTAM